jgi:hypothetical protein
MACHPFSECEKDDTLLLTVNQCEKHKSYVLIVEKIINNIFGDTVLIVYLRRPAVRGKIFISKDGIIHSGEGSLGGVGKVFGDFHIQLSRVVLVEKVIPSCVYPISERMVVDTIPLTQILLHFSFGNELHPFYQLYLQ